MEKNIWVIADDRKTVLEAQRSINSTMSMRAVCILSYEALERFVLPDRVRPSLIILDYEMSCKEEFRSLALLKEQRKLVGVPLVFMTEYNEERIQDDCYMRGGLAVLLKPFSSVSIERIEQMAWQFEVAQNTEKKLEKQAIDLKAAREIERLNQQLQARNDLLYQVFGRYFSDEFMERIFQDPTSVSIGGERKDMTVMMADLRGFTAISQQMDSDAMMDLLNFYFSKMVEIIRCYKGTVIEFLGDGILVVFGAPIPLEEHTESAIAAAITMQNAMEEVNAYCAEKGYEQVDMGIGIHSGEVFIGNIGSDKVMRYNVIGKVVNECSRIEGYCVGSQVLVSTEAVRRIRCDYTQGDTIDIKAKGVGFVLKVHEVTFLGGSYQCTMREEEQPPVFGLQEPVVLELNRIIEKLVDENTVAAKLHEISCKGARIVMEGKEELGWYTDVKILARNSAGSVLFDDVYAKVIPAKDHAIMLHFTHINGDLQRYINQLEQGS